MKENTIELGKKPSQKRKARAEIVKDSKNLNPEEETLKRLKTVLKRLDEELNDVNTQVDETLKQQEQKKKIANQCKKKKEEKKATGNLKRECENCKKKLDSTQLFHCQAAVITYLQRISRALEPESGISDATDALLNSHVVQRKKEAKKKYCNECLKICPYCQTEELETFLQICPCEKEDWSCCAPKKSNSAHKRKRSREIPRTHTSFPECKQKLCRLCTGTYYDKKTKKEEKAFIPCLIKWSEGAWQWSDDDPFVRAKVMKMPYFSANELKREFLSQILDDPLEFTRKYDKQQDRNWKKAKKNQEI